MYLHFENGTSPELLQKISNEGLTHGDRIIKVMAYDIDQRIALGRSALTIVESSGEAFTADEKYDYQKRRSFSGDELEEKLAELAGDGLGQVGQRIIRSLFRFSNAYGFCQVAMAATKKGQQWRIRHPFEDIYGIHRGMKSPLGERMIHLKIFDPVSLKELKQVVKYNNETAITRQGEWHEWLKKDPELRAHGEN